MITGKGGSEKNFPIKNIFLILMITGKGGSEYSQVKV